jgi:hypothetical protein
MLSTQPPLLLYITALPVVGFHSCPFLPIPAGTRMVTRSPGRIDFWNVFGIVLVLDVAN